jgi:hypothetical protein
MESKTEWAKYALAGGLALVTIGGLYYMFSGGKTEEEIEEEEDGMTEENLKESMMKEIAELKTAQKMKDKVLSEEYILNIFYILNKYTTLFKLCEDKQSLEERVAYLREKNSQKYEEVRKQQDLAETDKMEALQKQVFEEFGCTENDYVTGYQTHSNNPAFGAKMMEYQKNVVNSMQEQNKKSLPESLTKEVAQEIRDFAKNETQRILRNLQSTETDQTAFNEKFMFEVSKLDDVIYLKYGFKNTDVLKAFHEYNLIPSQNQMPMNM